MYVKLDTNSIRRCRFLLFWPFKSNFKKKILLWNRGVYLGFRFLLHFFPREQKRCSRSERSQSILEATTPSLASR